MFLTIITFIIILGLLILVHEIGHFITAKKFRVRCPEFGLGLPPRILGFVKMNNKWKFIRGKTEKEKRTNNQDKNSPTEAKFTPQSSQSEEGKIGTIWSLNWLPLGGFVNIKGEDGSSRQEPDSFGAQPIWKRAIILFSGVGMNFILAMLLFVIGFMLGLPQIIDETIPKYAKISNEKIQIISVAENSIAAQEGIIIQDEVLSIDGQTFETVEQAQKYIAENNTKELALKLKRGGEEKEVKIIPQELELEDGTTEKVLGVGLVKTATIRYPIHYAIWEGVVTTILLMKLIIVAFYDVVIGLITTGKLTLEISGPVGIAVVTSQVVNLGFIYVLQFAALLSINLGIINFFPFPALDGGRFIGLLIEGIRKKPNNQKIEAWIHNAGFVALLALFALITYRDIFRFIKD